MPIEMYTEPPKIVDKQTAQQLTSEQVDAFTRTPAFTNYIDALEKYRILYPASTVDMFTNVHFGVSDDAVLSVPYTREYELVFFGKRVHWYIGYTAEFWNSLTSDEWLALVAQFVAYKELTRINLVEVHERNDSGSRTTYSLNSPYTALYSAFKANALASKTIGNPSSIQSVIEKMDSVGIYPHMVDVSDGGDNAYIGVREQVVFLANQFSLAGSQEPNTNKWGEGQHFSNKSEVLEVFLGRHRKTVLSATPLKQHVVDGLIKESNKDLRVNFMFVVILFVFGLMFGFLFNFFINPIVSGLIGGLIGAGIIYGGATYMITQKKKADKRALAYTLDRAHYLKIGVED